MVIYKRNKSTDCSFYEIVIVIQSNQLITNYTVFEGVFYIKTSVYSISVLI